MKEKVNIQKGFIRIPLLIAIIMGVFVIGAGGYIGIKQYQDYHVRKTGEIKQTQEKEQSDQKLAEEMEKDIVASDTDATPFQSSTSTPASALTPAVASAPRGARSVDLVDFQSSRNGAWFSVDLNTLPEIQQKPAASFDIKNSAVDNRKSGQINPALSAGYLFLQWDISSSAFEKYADSINALFIRSSLMSFVDYPNNRVLGWDRKSVNIPMDIRGIIRICNKRNIPVFLEINYSDYVPGPVGTGVESLQRADNISGTLAFIQTLKAQGLNVDGVSFGDEIEDDAGYGGLKPTIHNSDLIGRFISYARAFKSEIPKLKLYAFDSYIGATRGQVSAYWDFFQKIRQAEINEGINLLDGFTFRESCVYMDENSKILDSQFILDDTESLYRDATVYRYDVTGISHPSPDRDYLHTLINKTAEIFGRFIDIGLSEYLPAGPIQISETDTSRYSDVDFIIHYSDIVGIYAQLGLDVVSKIMFGDSLDMHKAYFDRNGNKGVNYPVQEQLAQHFAGEILSVDRSVDYDSLKVKVYAARKDNKYFVMILNKDVGNAATVKVTLPGQSDLTVRLPRRSYTSLLVGENKITVAGIGN